VLRTGEPEFVPDIPPEMLRAAARGPEHLEAILALGLRSYLCLPLIARGRTLGALTVAYAESARRYGPTELQVAEELARRAAVAIDNARLFGEMEDARNALEQQTAELEETQAEMEMAHDELQHAYEDLAARTMEAERARAAADEANAAKSSFLATMSHELRTPLNAIAGYAQLMEMGIHGEVTRAQAEALAKIRRNQVHLLGLINDVLNFAKLEAGQVQYQVRELPLDEVLAAVEPLVEPQLRARGLTYVYRPGDPAVTVCADRERMEQVVLNLLTNAIKFTEPGGRVEMGWEADGGTVSVHVRDTGRGIPADKLDAIFEPFVQVDPALTRAAEGTGLGLAISRDLARAMNGDLRVTSREDEGSVFTLVLPRGSA
jgi:signal transduction histidine kinase